MIKSAVIAGVMLMSGGLAFAGPGASGHGHGQDENTAYGRPGDPGKPSRVITITMRETDDGKMLFAPDEISVRRGEQIRFKVVNAGDVDHEMTVATFAENQKHKVQMQKNPDMEHDDPNAVRVKPTASGEILWAFTKAGEFEFACLIPGHYESGMKGVIVVK